MKQYNITGMSCAACSARIENAVGSLPGVDRCAVNLLTNSMGVEGTASEESIIKAVEGAGYGASPKVNSEDILEDKETPVIRRRLIMSIFFLVFLMYLSMGHSMLGLPLPGFLEGYVPMGISQMVLAAIIMIINRKFFVSGVTSAFHKAPNMDTLVALGAGVAFAFSVYSFIRGAEVSSFYFDSPAMILTLITVGKLLEARSKGRTTDALKSLMQLAPKQATVIRDDKEYQVDVSEVRLDDLFVVKPGESIPVDGEVEEGISAVDEAALTGESIPVDKGPGDMVCAATINTSGHLICRATRIGEDTTLSQIIKMVSDAAATKAPIARIADRISGIFVPVVITIAVIVTAIWLIAGAGIEEAINFGVSVLVISCPCALGLATPVAIMVGSGKGARNGILFKTAVALEQAGRVKTIILDKTGTITEGSPVVTDVIPAWKGGEKELLTLARNLESMSEHPLAKAIMAYTEGIESEAVRVSNFSALPGNGLTGYMDDKLVFGGNLDFVQAQVDIPDELEARADQLAEEGKTPMFFARDEEFLGIIAVADTVKKGSAEAIGCLKDMGLEVIMLTGDNAKSAGAVGRQVGVNSIIAGVLPQDKERIVRECEAEGPAIMVGDGINDAPALTRASVGMAIGAGTDVAIDAADVVLMNSDIMDVVRAVKLSRGTLRNIHQNLFWAFIYNIIGIPVAAGALVPALGVGLNPMMAAACMSISSFCVVTNSLRLNLLKLDSNRSKIVKNCDDQITINDLSLERKKKEEELMKKTLRIEGMMCPHCEATVKKTLEAFDAVESAEVSHEADTAVISMSQEISDAELKAAIEDKGYEVVGIE